MELGQPQTRQLQIPNVVAFLQNRDQIAGHRQLVPPSNHVRPRAVVGVQRKAVLETCPIVITLAITKVIQYRAPSRHQLE